MNEPLGKDGLTEGHLLVIKIASEEFGKIAINFGGNDPRAELLLFSKLTEITFNYILKKIAEMEGVPDPVNLDYDLCLNIVVNAVSRMNGELPLDHPFLVAIFIQSESDELKIASIIRSSIPGIHDNLHRDVIPIIKTRGTVGVERLLKFDKINVDFIGPINEIPPDIFKD